MEEKVSSQPTLYHLDKISILKLVSAVFLLIIYINSNDLSIISIDILIWESILEHKDLGLYSQRLLS